jgi:hypothetical protein
MWMKRKNLARLLVSGAVGSLLIATLPGCVHSTFNSDATGRIGVDDPAVLKQRAETLWKAKVTEDWPTAYTFLMPYERVDSTVSEFAAWSEAEEPFIVRSFDIGRAQTEGSHGWVEVAYSSVLRRFSDLPARKAHLWQNWKRIDDTWYPVPGSKSDEQPEPPIRRDQSAEATLRQRFARAWELRVERDWHVLYGMCDPADRIEVDEDAMREAEERIIYVEHEIDWVEVIEGSGRVRVLYRHKLSDPSLSKMRVQALYVIEDWVEREGVWYRDLVR